MTMTEPMWAFLILTALITTWALVAEERQLRRRDRQRHQEWLRCAPQITGSRR